MLQNSVLLPLQRPPPGGFFNGFNQESSGMTTVAWDGTTLASDSQSSSGDMVCTLREQKVFTPPENEQWSVNGELVVAVGTAGDCGIEAQLFGLMSKNLTFSTEFTPEPDFTALAMTANGRAWIISKKSGDAHASISLQLDSYAIGSGGLIALSAMRCGKNAIDAVKVAVELDLYSGGKVQSFSTTAEVKYAIQD